MAEVVVIDDDVEGIELSRVVVDVIVILYTVYVR